VVIGSETSGGIRNIFIRDCTFNGTDRGLRFKTARGRGAVIENIWVQDIRMGEIVKEAIIVNTLRYTKRYPAHRLTERTPTYRNLNFLNISCEYAKKPGIRIVGLPEKPMEGLRFENIVIKAAAGIQVQDAGEIQFKNVSIFPDKGPVLQLDECFTITVDSVKYPKEVDTFMQLIGKKTKGIKLSNVDMKAIANKILYGKGVTEDAVTFQN
jgi:DNA sulfur modification protein DndE